MTQRKRPRAAASRSMVARMGETALRRPVHVLGAAAVCAFAAAISLNALAFQTRTHPAPLFHTPEPTLARAVPSNPPTVPQRPVPTARPSADAAVLPPARPASIAELAAAAATDTLPAVARSRDPIADMIRSGRVDSSPAVVQPSAPVASAQRALTKLGYGPLKDDGVLGSGTRQAIEQFERDRNWPVTGELNQRVTRELAASTGIAIQ